MLHDFEVEGGEEIRASEGSAGVSALNAVNHPDDISPDLGCDVLEWVHGLFLVGAKVRKIDPVDTIFRVFRP